MGLVRAAPRLVGVVVVTSVMYVGWALSRLSGLVSSDAARASHRWFVRTWAHALLRVLGVRVTVRGRPPEPPFFLASNHLSYVDIPVLLSEVDCVFLAKSEIARWPVAGWIARTTGTRFVDRGKKSDLMRVNREVADVLDGGGGLTVFPEGTSTQGVEVLPFRPSVFEAPVALGCRVSSATLRYETPDGARPADLAVCWWGDMGFLPHFAALLTLPSIRAELTFGAAIPAGEDRKTLARRSHAEVSRAFVPVVSVGASRTSTV